MTRKKTGFTIVELMVAIALMLMLMGVAVFIFVNAVQIFTKTSAETQIYQAAQVAMDTLRKEIRGTKPLLTPNGTPNTQQFFVQFDEPKTIAGSPWRFDRLCFKTTTNDPATPDQTATRWVIYWVKGGSTTAPGTTGTLMKYVSSNDYAPPESSGVSNINLPTPDYQDGPPDFPDWDTDGAELCQYVSFFGVEIFYDPDTDSNTEGQFFDRVTATAAPNTGIQGYPTWDSATFGAYFTAGWPEYLRLNSCSSYTTGYDITASTIKLPSQMRITLRVRDPNQKQERTIQEQVWIPVAD